ncbi:hypothetical protein SAMD00019534_057670, partial [Acytostelium subglobosum LB1]|uniref:hypothetical protein n=1 Tax=Acytostelium subglobosum LB1 TaxID=1410327 RepID=UPI0006447DE7
MLPTSRPEDSPQSSTPSSVSPCSPTSSDTRESTTTRLPHTIKQQNGLLLLLSAIAATAATATVAAADTYIYGTLVLYPTNQSHTHNSFIDVVVFNNSDS